MTNRFPKYLNSFKHLGNFDKQISQIFKLMQAFQKLMTRFSQILSLLQLSEN